MTASTDLPQWAIDILAAVPKRGGGLNRWFLAAAIALRRCERTEQEIQKTLEAATTNEAVRAGEIERAVKRSADYMKDSPHPTTRRKWPDPDEQARRDVIDRVDGGVVELWERSPYRLVDDGPDTEALIELLFPDNPLLCCAIKLHGARTAPREKWRGRLGRMQFVVPSPMNATTGKTQDGRLSTRCLDNTGPRKYLIIEQDAGTFDHQAAVLLHLATRAPMAMALMSGGKSLHGWFACRGADDATLRQFFALAVRLGADAATWTRCQLVRMPEGRRDNGCRQAVIFLNQDVI